ncbi:hypothetical protein PENTCL1PPCAC_13345, partial [Pristionchus entomophagus]
IEELPFSAVISDMEATQERVRKAVDQMVLEVDKDYLRGMQKAMFNCSARCCDDRKGPREAIESCIEQCNLPMMKAQRVLEAELTQLQSSLSRCAMTGYDKLMAQYGPDHSKYSAADRSAFDKNLEQHVSLCADEHVKQLADIKKRFAKSL